jgi:SOUL heme-binding protein
MFRARCLSLALLFSVVFFLIPYTLMAIEEAAYQVVEHEGDFELRQYQPQVVAATLVAGDFEAVGNEGFRRLFAYISGQNRSRESLPMTAPVSQAAASRKIPMTAPVNQEKAGELWQITFTMPAGSSLATLPEPLDTRIKLLEVPSRLIVALRYSGTWTQERYDQREKQLLELIRQKGLVVAGEPIFARYNPPFMPWFLRRNEVLIPVVRP